MTDAARLFAEHRTGVFRYLWRIVGQADTARDLTQEVFLRVARAEAPNTEDGRRAWVFRIARNLALNHVRDEQRRPVIVTGIAEPAQSANSTQPATQEVSAAVNQALAALADLDRHVFLMRETAGLSYDEIAAACELTPDAVRSRLHRARQQLREALGGPIDARQQQGIRSRSHHGRSI